MPAGISFRGVTARTHRGCRRRLPLREARRARRRLGIERIGACACVEATLAPGSCSSSPPSEGHKRRLSESTARNKATAEGIALSHHQRLHSDCQATTSATATTTHAAPVMSDTYRRARFMNSCMARPNLVLADDGAQAGSIARGNGELKVVRRPVNCAIAGIVKAIEDGM
jgi:hypothetical protein